MHNNSTHFGERPRDARCAKDGKGEYEDHDLRAAVERATQDVVVLAIPSWVVPAQPKLRNKSDGYRRREDRVYAIGLRTK